MTRDAGDPALIVRETILFALRSPAAVLELPPGDLDLTLRLIAEPDCSDGWRENFATRDCWTASHPLSPINC